MTEGGVSISSDQIIYAIQAVFGVLIGLIGWMMRKIDARLDKESEQNNKNATDIREAETRIAGMEQELERIRNAQERSLNNHTELAREMSSVMTGVSMLQESNNRILQQLDSIGSRLSRMEGPAT